MTDRKLDAITEALRELPLEQRVSGYGYDEIPGKAELLELLEMPDLPCPRGVDGCDGMTCQWTCPDCGCHNCHEVFCWHCGAGAPEKPCGCPCPCMTTGQRDDDGTPGWCDSCRMNIHREG